MSKKIVFVISTIVTVIILCGIAMLGAFFYERNDVYEWPYEVNVGMRTEVTWDIDDEIPNQLPVYTVEKAADTSYIWRNIIAFCGFKDDIMFTYDASFSTEDWQISVDEDGEIRCWYNDRKFNTNMISHIDYPELEELAWSFLERLGVRIENYYISGYPIDPEGIYRILDFSYKLGEYEAEEWPVIISISYVGDMITDLTIRCEDLTEYSSVSVISMDEIKEQFKDMSFYTTSPDLAKMNILKNLNISDIDITYVRENNMLVPYLSLVGEMHCEPISGDVTSSQIKAYDGVIRKKSIADYSVNDSKADEKLILKKIEEFYEFALRTFESRDFQTAALVFPDVIEEINETEMITPQLTLLKNKAQLYASLAYIQLEKYYSTFNALERCKEYFDQIALEGSTYIKTQELTTLRIYTCLALSHLYTSYNDYHTSAKYLEEAREHMGSIACDKTIELFYAYEKAYLSPEDADELLKLIEDWAETYTEKEKSNYYYYSPLMYIMAARRYLKTDTQKAYEIIKYELMDQDAYFGASPNEKMRILAETYDLYADYLETQSEKDFQKILSNKKMSASLYESLMLVHYDRLIIDGVYYKQTGEAYYKQAVLYAEMGQTEAALCSLEHSLKYLTEVDGDAFIVLCDAWSLGEKLYREVGDDENTSRCSRNLRLLKDELPKLLEGVHPIDFCDLICDDNTIVHQPIDAGSAVVQKNYKAQGAFPRMNIAQLVITKEGVKNQSLERAVMVLSEEIDKITRKYADSLSLSYLHCLANGYLATHNLETDLCITRWDEKIISILLRVDYYTNGSHDITTFHAFNYSIAEGKLLTESELVDTEIYETAFQVMQETYIDMLFIDEVDSENSEVILSPVGYTFIFNPGIGATYVNGPLSITILFNDSSEYKSALSFVSEIPAYVPFTSVNNVIYAIYNNVEGTEYKGFKIEREGDAYYVETAFSLSSNDRLYYILFEGKEYITVQDSSAHKMYVYLLSDNEYVKRSTISVNSNYESDSTVVYPIYTEFNMITHLLP